MLGARCHRPHRRSAEQRNELAPPHSIASQMLMRAGYQFSNHAAPGIAGSHHALTCEDRCGSRAVLRSTRLECLLSPHKPADVIAPPRLSESCQEPKYAVQQKTCLFDHLVGPG